MLAAGILTALLALGANAKETSRLAVIQQAPGFTLTTQAGKKIELADLKGKVLLVSFIFTTCNGTCPATTHRLARIQQELKSRKFGKGEVHFLSITLDPARDTPDVLRGYMKLYDVDPANWSFLTGPPSQVLKTVSDWGMWVKPTTNGQLDHPSRIFLVDRRGRIREIYHLGFLKADWVADDVQLLLQER